MYRGYKNYRAYLNRQLHALSAVICGDDTVIDSELASRGLKSVKALPLNEARALCKQLTEIAKNVSHNTNKLKAAIGLGNITSNQRRAIIKVTQYIFKWTKEGTFSFILDTIPDHRKRLSLWEIENSKLNHLFGLLTMKEADKIIKRLDQIQKRNQKSEVRGQLETTNNPMTNDLMTNDQFTNVQQTTDNKQHTPDAPLSN